MVTSIMDHATQELYASSHACILGLFAEPLEKTPWTTQVDMDMDTHYREGSALNIGLHTA